MSLADIANSITDKNTKKLGKKAKKVKQRSIKKMKRSTLKSISKSCKKGFNYTYVCYPIAYSGEITSWLESEGFNTIISSESVGFGGNTYNVRIGW